jgi:predicted alpha/beta superfamily hydrolase
MQLWGAGVLLASLLAGTAAAQTTAYTPDEKVVVPFALTLDTGIGREVFVVGNHADIGDWNPVAARKLRWTSGNVWTGGIAIAAGHDLVYKYIVRTNTGAAYCAANVLWMPDPNLTTSVPARADAPFIAKTLYYYSGWTNAFLLHRSGSDTNWTDTAMTRIGDGRIPGESLYRAEGIGKAGELLTFVPHGYFNGTEYWDNTPIPGVPDYFTRLDAFVLQDGHLFNYWPPASRTDSAIATNFVASSYTPQAPGRNIRVYTPRNYAQNPHKRYPVLYLHDGQNVFRPGGGFGCWFAEDAADQMISLGQMRETILVAVDNTGERMREYLPPTDAYDGTGTADRYLGYVVHDVKPFVDAAYRTLTDRENTGVLGSSFGGVASLYFGLSTNVFGKIGPMSASFLAIPNYLDQRVYGQDTSGLRIYTDFGTAEQEASFQAMWNAYNKFLADGYVPNDTVRIEVGCGQAHNEPAWASRVHMPMTFLFNARDEANELLLRAAPPRLEMDASGGDLTFTFVGLKGWNTVLQRTPALFPATWQDVATGRVDHLMWSGQELADTLPGGPGEAYYRIESRVPAP